MNQAEIIRFVASGLSTKRPSSKKIGESLGLTYKLVESLIAQIKTDGLFAITRSQGGGISIASWPTREKDIYVHVGRNLEHWIKMSIYGGYGDIRQKISPTHTKKLSGKWTNPDFTSLCVHKFLHAPQSSIELITVEIKFAEIQFDVSCVYEALAHTRVGTYSILFFYETPFNTYSDRGQIEVFEEIKAECVRTGVGLVISSYPCDVASWHYIIPAKKHEPDLRKVDDFINDAFTQTDKDWLTKAL